LVQRERRTVEAFSRKTSGLSLAYILGLKIFETDVKSFETEILVC